MFLGVKNKKERKKKQFVNIITIHFSSFFFFYQKLNKYIHGSGGIRTHASEETGA